MHPAVQLDVSFGIGYTIADLFVSRFSNMKFEWFAEAQEIRFLYSMIVF